MEQILAHCLPKETFTTTTMLYKNMKPMVRSLDGDTVFSKIVTGLLELGPFLFILFLD